MPVAITEVLKDAGVANASAILTDLIAKLSIYPPTCLATQNSSHFYDVYRQKLASDAYGLDKMLLMKVQLEIASTVMAQQLAPPVYVNDLFQSSMTIEQCKKKSQVNFVLARAWSFAHTGIGNCSERAAYAAFQLFNIFQETNIKVSVISAPTIDHFVVYIGNEDKGWQVYDPLTNPTLIFTLAEYRQNILPLFSPLAQPKDKVKVVIKAPIMTLFSGKEEQARALLQSGLQTPAQLMAYGDYRLWLQSKNITHAQQKTELAYHTLVNALEPRQTLSISNAR